MIKQLAAIDNYTLYENVDLHIFKIHDGTKVISHPSSYKAAMEEFLFVTNREERSDCPDCDRYYYYDWRIN